MGENVVGLGPSSEQATVLLEQQPPAPLVTIEPLDEEVYVTASTDHTSMRYPILLFTCSIYKGSTLAGTQDNDLGMFKFAVTNGAKYKAQCYVSNVLGDGEISSYTFEVTPGKPLLTIIEYNDVANTLNDKDSIRNAIALVLNPSVEKERLFVTSVSHIEASSYVVSFHRMLASNSDYEIASQQIVTNFASST